MACYPKRLRLGMVIYLASPYSYSTGLTQEANQLMMEWNFNKVCEVAAEYMSRGFVVFCPIAHSHPIAMTGDCPQEDWKFWAHQDLPLLERCDAVVQVCMPLWEKSKGAHHERNFAAQLGKHVSFSRDYYYDIDFRKLDRGEI